VGVVTDHVAEPPLVRLCGRCVAFSHGRGFRGHLLLLSRERLRTAAVAFDSCIVCQWDGERQALVCALDGGGHLPARGCIWLGCSQSLDRLGRQVGKQDACDLLGVGGTDQQEGIAVGGRDGDNLADSRLGRHRPTSRWHKRVVSG